MALNAFALLKGKSQGEIKGESTQRGEHRDDALEIYGWNHEVISPRDAASGLPTGKRQHKPLQIIKKIDKASPLLMNALCTNEEIEEFTMRLYRPERSGSEQFFFEIKITGANISSIRHESRFNKEEKNMRIEPLEYVSLTYQTISWSQVVDSTTAQDSWAEAVMS